MRLLLCERGTVMYFTEFVLYLFEVLGTIAFSVSGAMAAVEKKTDVFGVVFLGLVTSFGGGIMRDTLLGRMPAVFFTNYKFIIIALAAAIVVFVSAYVFKENYEYKQCIVNRINNIFDALGLGVFSVAGAEVVLSGGLADNTFLAVCMGIITAVGGGFLRDIMTCEIPFILRKRVYALAAASGALVYCTMLHFDFSTAVSLIIGASATIILRLCATFFKWDLPTAIK